MSVGSVPSGVVVLDTNVTSELMRSEPNPDVAAWVIDVAPALVHTTAVTLAEIRFGIARLPAGRRRALLENAADDVFDAFADHVLPFDAAAADHYAEIVVERERTGAPIAGFDAQIAAICRSNRAALATRNIDDFAGLDLDLIDPWRVDA